MWRPVGVLLQSPKSSGRSGLTLVELLLVAALFAAILGAVSHLVFSSLRAHLGSGGAAAGYHRMEQQLARLEQDLESAQPVPGAVFVGTAELLQLTRVDHAAGGDGDALDWVRVTYRLDGEALVRESIVWRQGTASEPVRETLFAVTDGAFAFGETDVEGRFHWAPVWDGVRLGIPRLVQLTGTVPVTLQTEPFALSRTIRHPAGILSTPEPGP